MQDPLAELWFFRKSVKKCFYPLLLALKHLEPESATAGGLYFLGNLYLLSEVLPILSKTFQRGELSYAHMHKLCKRPVEPANWEAKEGGVYKEPNCGTQGWFLVCDDNQAHANIKDKYVTSLIQNIDKRFS